MYAEATPPAMRFRALAIDPRPHAIGVYSPLAGVAPIRPGGGSRCAFPAGLFRAACVLLAHFILVGCSHRFHNDGPPGYGVFDRADFVGDGTPDVAEGQDSMAVDRGEYDLDGSADAYVGSYERRCGGAPTVDADCELNTIWRRPGDGCFQDVSATWGLEARGRSIGNLGDCVLDTASGCSKDDDGDLDLCGADLAHRWRIAPGDHDTSSLGRNNGAGASFTDVRAASGMRVSWYVLSPVACGEGAAGWAARRRWRGSRSAAGAPRSTLTDLEPDTSCVAYRTGTCLRRGTAPGSPRVFRSAVRPCPAPDAVLGDGQSAFYPVDDPLALIEIGMDASRGEVVIAIRN